MARNHHHADKRQHEERHEPMGIQRDPPYDATQREHPDRQADTSSEYQRFFFKDNPLGYFGKRNYNQGEHKPGTPCVNPFYKKKSQAYGSQGDAAETHYRPNLRRDSIGIVLYVSVGFQLARHDWSKRPSDDPNEEPEPIPRRVVSRSDHYPDEGAHGYAHIAPHQHDVAIAYVALFRTGYHRSNYFETLLFGKFSVFHFKKQFREHGMKFFTDS